MNYLGNRLDHDSFRDSYLIQRLEKPWESEALGMKDNPFNFGGGLVNGGLSPKAMDLLRPIFQFDYMGAAEFEFGAVPEALNQMTKIKDLTPWRLTLKDNEIAKERDWDTRKDLPIQSNLIYIISSETDKADIEGVIKKCALNQQRLKCGTQLSRAMRQPDCRIQGWLELDNGFMFFTDGEMFEKTCKIFFEEV